MKDFNVERAITLLKDYPVIVKQITEYFYNLDLHEVVRRARFYHKIALQFALEEGRPVSLAYEEITMNYEKLPRKFLAKEAKERAIWDE